MLKASIVDLRYQTKELLQAIDRNEMVEILYHGKSKAFLVPATYPGVDQSSKSFIQSSVDLKQHPYFGSCSAASETEVLETMNQLRKGRY